MRSVRCFLAFPILLFAVALFFPAEASARQCVFNKGGYVLLVHWYRKGDVVLDRYDCDDEHCMYSGQVHNVQPPVKSDSLTAGFGSCNNTDEQLIAFLDVAGCLAVKARNGNLLNCMYHKLLDPWSSDPTSDNAIIGVDVPILFRDQPRTERFILMPETDVDQKACTGVYAGLGCRHRTVEFPDSGSSIALVAVPSQNEYLDFWGGIADVTWGPGGPIASCNWVNGTDASYSADAGRGITDPAAHFRWVSGGGAVLPASADFVKNRMGTLSRCLSPDNYARLYASASVAIAAAGRTNAGWIDGADDRSPFDYGRGVSDWNTHYGAAQGTGLPKAADWVGGRMMALTALPLDVYAKLYADVSVMIAKCGALGQCGP